MTYVIDFGGTSLCRTESLIESEIPYRISGANIDILGVLHKRMDPGLHL